MDYSTEDALAKYRKKQEKKDAQDVGEDVLTLIVKRGWAAAKKSYIVGP